MLLMHLILVPQLRNPCSRAWECTMPKGKDSSVSHSDTDYVLSQRFIPTQPEAPYANWLLLTLVAGSEFSLRCLEGCPSANNVIFLKTINK